MSQLYKNRWRRLAVRLSHIKYLAKLGKRMARWGLPPHTGLWPLSKLHTKGFISDQARLAHPGIELGERCFIGDQTRSDLCD